TVRLNSLLRGLLLTTRVTFFPTRRSSDLCMKSKLAVVKSSSGWPRLRTSVTLEEDFGQHDRRADVQVDAAAAHPPHHFGEQPEVDRKSTRLNSSHSQISYAVFCLKKKNNS